MHCWVHYPPPKKNYVKLLISRIMNGKLFNPLLGIFQMIKWLKTIFYLFLLN